MIRLAGIGLLAFLILLLEQRLYRKLWSRNLKVSVNFSRKNIFEGEESELIEIVENCKKLPLSMLKVKFQTNRNLLFEISEGSQTTDQYYRNDVFQIGGGEKITRTLVFKGGKRGLYRIQNADLVAADLFLTAQMVDTQSLDGTSLYVYPKPFDSDEFRQSLKQLNGEILTKRHLLEDPFEYRGIREYQPLDDMRSINWKASAKLGGLMVNQKNYTALESVRIFLNLEDNGVLKKQDCVEAAIRITAGLCETFLREGLQVACYCNAAENYAMGSNVMENSTSGRNFTGNNAIKSNITGSGATARNDTISCMTIEASAGTGQMSAIYRGLALLDENRVLPFAEAFGRELAQKEKGIFTCFISPNAYGDWVEMIEEYQDEGRDYIWFYPIAGAGKPEISEKLKRNVRILSIS